MADVKAWVAAGLIWGFLFGPIVLLVFWVNIKKVTGRLIDDYEDHIEPMASGERVASPQ